MDSFKWHKIWAEPRRATYEADVPEGTLYLHCEFPILETVPITTSMVFVPKPRG